jgi:hypothetical protein
MTRTEVGERAHELLDHLKMEGWCVGIIMFQSEWREMFPDAVNAAGICSHRRMTIFFNSRYIHNDEFTEETIEHEIAHILQQPGTENHGPEFKTAFDYVRDEVRKMDDDNRPRCEGLSSTYYLRHPEKLPPFAAALRSARISCK